MLPIGCEGTVFRNHRGMIRADVVGWSGTGLHLCALVEIGRRGWPPRSEEEDGSEDDEEEGEDGDQNTQ